MFLVKTFKILFLIIVAAHVIPKSYCQIIINGTITDTTGRKVTAATVLVRPKSEISTIANFTIAREGSFKIVLSKHYDSLIVEVISIFYKPARVQLRNVKPDSAYYLEFRLEEAPPVELEEVLVQASPYPVQQKGDTTTYAITEYMDGTEQKVEDVLRKLPGIEVNTTTGEIKFKGKPVERILLDGDDLFGLNYTLPSKNINARVLQGIQAIENYTENPLLKDIENSDRVALNLQLKKQLDVSGNLTAGLGTWVNHTPARNLDANLLAVQQAAKWFVTLQSNNVGINNSPFDYFDFTLTPEQQLDEPRKFRPIIPEDNLANQLPEERVNINNQHFGNYNGVFTLHRSFRIRANLFAFTDRLTSTQLVRQEYNFDSLTLLTTDETDFTRRPLQLRSDLNLRWQPSSSTLMEYGVKALWQNVETNRKTLQNEQQNFNSSLSTNEYFISQNFTLTKKVSTNRAWQLLVNHYRNTHEQELLISPAVLNSNLANLQFTDAQKNTLIAEAKLLLAPTNRHKLYFSTGYSGMQIPFRSGLDSMWFNRLNYNTHEWFSASNFVVRLNRWQVGLQYRLRLLTQRLPVQLPAASFHQNSWLSEPQLALKYMPTRYTAFRLTAEIQRNPLAEKYLFRNPVLINSRSLVWNSPSLAVSRKEIVQMSYVDKDLSKTVQWSTGLVYEKNSRLFFAESTISETTIQLRHFFAPEQTQRVNAWAEASMYVPSLQSTIKLKTDYSVFWYRNVINESVFRKNRQDWVNSEFFFKTAFDGPFNFEYDFTYTRSLSSSENQTEKFTNTSLTNQFSIIITPAQHIRVYGSYHSTIPDARQPANQFTFVDLSAMYAPEKSKWSARIQARNLTGTTAFNEISTSDISLIRFRSNLLPRMLLVTVTFSL